MQAGRLRHRVTIQVAAETQNMYGETIQSWSDVATVWAAVEPLRGREYLAATQEQRELTTRITIRWRPGVNPGNRVVWTDPGGITHIYDIEDVIPDPTGHRWIELMCTEDVDA
jgi:SPP1 family predicted phage head-tail adaptor